MDWVKLDCTYYLDGAIVLAGEAAEVLFTRAMAWCGDQENGGFVPREVLPRLTPTRGAARARALVTHGLWVEVGGGWRFVAWDRHQTTREQLDAKRQAGRERQQSWRDRKKSTRDGVRNGVTNADVTQREVEVEVEVDAAAAATREPPPLPVDIEILRAGLEASKMSARWDRLTPEQTAEIQDLIDVHGDGPLIRSAISQHRPDRPAAFAQAWLTGWRHLRRPGDLALVPTSDPCTKPGHTGTVRHCNQCASEQKAAR
ncbi:hypothetical protein GCM10009737_08050 [Nocardioides lentus]|uniref:Helix-turn-helix DNA binding domain protein n=1 Tax=Nocardioides lentus TaxID=338077 RepID=A0ABP5AEW2_9ACTN